MPVVARGSRAWARNMSPIVLIVLALATVGSPQPAAPRICYLPYCECIPTDPHPFAWTTVNCTNPTDKELNIRDGDLPENTTDFLISGAGAVLFDTNSLSRLRDARRIRVVDTRLLRVKNYASVNLKVNQVYMEVEGCDTVSVEERAFKNLKGALLVTIKDCEVVSIAEEAFSSLLEINISDIKQLVLAQGSLKLDQSEAIMEKHKHGPAMKILLKNLTVSEFHNRTFGSPAAEITFDNIHVETIRAESFTALKYNVITVVNSTIDLIDKDAFANKAYIETFVIKGCKIRNLSTDAIQSAVKNMYITRSKFRNISSSAIHIFGVNIMIIDSRFGVFEERGFEFSTPSKLYIERCIFDEIKPNAIVVQDASLLDLAFMNNDIETLDAKSLSIFSLSIKNITYNNNYFGKACYCNVTEWLTDVLDVESAEAYAKGSYCTVDDFFARCFNVPEQNMLMDKFEESVCYESSIQCEPYKSKINGEATEIKNPKFPHKKEEGLTHRNAKVIGIVIVTIFGCIIIALIFSTYKWLRQKSYCLNFKNFLVSSNSSCGSFCDRFCACGNNRIENARSMSRLSVNEYSERHRLNEMRVQDSIQETEIPNMYAEPEPDINDKAITEMDDKTTQTLPEELTKELLENLKQKLDDPVYYVEAREMIEHLYELIKVEESCNSNTPTYIPEENIYELPFQNTAPRIGKNKKQMISVGTRTPSLDKLIPLSPYNRQTALAHEYFEPKDFAVHLYAEIANNDREKKMLKNQMPDVVVDQAIPRGPYLKAVRDKMGSPDSSALTKSNKSLFNNSPRLQNRSPIKSNGSALSLASDKMLNRPLPANPVSFDPGEGTSGRR